MGMKGFIMEIKKKFAWLEDRKYGDNSGKEMGR